MKPIDFAKAFGVAFASLLITMAASFPMVTFYAYFIEPGQSQEFYTEAAQWIAPWSSYILGPIVFFAFNYWLARRSPERNAAVFAVATIGFYLAIDLSFVPIMGLDIGIFLTAGMAFWLAVKLAGALLGAHLGSRGKQVASD
jgi:hypothetical protein